VLATLVRVSDSAAPVDAEMAPARPGEVQRSCLDVTRARDELGWEAQAGLEDGLRDILATL
jgi:UDP-glucose 4-epimerase